MTIAESEALNGYIPSDMRSFYDPNAFFASSEHPEDALVGWLDKQRQEPIEVPVLGKVATRQLVAVELSHAGLLTHQDTSHQEWLELQPTAIEDAIESANIAALNIAQNCIRALAALRSQNRSLSTTSDVVLASALLAANTHKGEKRMSGRSYFTHPQAVALLMETAGNRHLSDPELRDLEVSDGLLHDGFEHAMQKDGSSFLRTPRLLVTPLIISTTLRELGASQPDADEAGKDNFALTKSVGPYGAMFWDAYEERFGTQPTAITSKLADLRHNRDIDPKIAPIDDPVKAQKVFGLRNQYRDTQDFLLSAYDGAVRPDWFRAHLFAAAISTLDLADLNRAKNNSAWGRIPESALIRAYEEAA